VNLQIPLNIPLVKEDFTPLLKKGAGGFSSLAGDEYLSSCVACATG
jgi:hypothetical protein